MEIRRYLDKKTYLNDLVEEGKLFVSTVSRCRSSEDKDRRDDLEGVRSFSNDGREMNGLPEEARLHGTNSVIEGDLSNIIAMEGSTILIAGSLRDAYILCFAGGDYDLLAARFSSEASFSICDIEGFGSLILDAFANAGISIYAYCYDAVTYVESKNQLYWQEVEHENVRVNNHLLQAEPEVNLSDIRRHFNNYFTKESGYYKDEKEFRFVFYPLDNTDVIGDGTILTLDTSKLSGIVNV
jgi:hypothetical protein